MYEQQFLLEHFDRALLYSSDSPSIVTRTKTSLSRIGEIRTVSDLIDLYKILDVCIIMLEQGALKGVILMFLCRRFV